MMTVKRLTLALFLAIPLSVAHGAAFETEFRNPPDAARPWVYWTCQDGHYSIEGTTADLEAMKTAGIGGVLRMDCRVGGIPFGGTPYLSEAWRKQFVHAVRECERLGLEFTTITGPGWTGTGGPWITAAQSMKHLVPATVNTKGPATFNQVLPLPQPRVSRYHRSQTPQMRKEISAFYKDVAVFAFPHRQPVIADIREKALFIRNPYTSMRGVRPYLPSPAGYPAAKAAQVIDPKTIIDVTGTLQADGRLVWNVPPGAWTIVRLGVRSTGANTRPAPAAGLGLESDKFSKKALATHFEAYFDPLLKAIGPRPKDRKVGFVALDADSWEMSSQNWTPGFRKEFTRRRGYDPWLYFTTYTGCVVGSREQTERFLWDVRKTCQELLLENHAAELKSLCHRRGLRLMIEPYDMNPAGDLDLGSYADFPAGEFWFDGFQSGWSCIAAASIAHTMGKPIVLAEGFTSGRGNWARSPWTLKNQTDWAFAVGINKFSIHGFAHQSNEDAPGMTFGPYGVFWNRKQTFWPLVGDYHKYLARCSHLLQQGVTVSDILYLTPEGAPQVFRAPPSALASAGGRLPDKKGYGFDGCSPRILMNRAEVRDGLICFPNGTSYRLMVLPNFRTMTPQLLTKIKDLVKAGAAVMGSPPVKSPSLADYPKCDKTVQSLVKDMWGDLVETATSKLTASSSQLRFPIQLAQDHNPGTRWISHGTKPGQGPSLEKPEYLKWEFTAPFSAASLVITPNADCGPKDCALQCSADGKTFQTISRFVVEQSKEKTVVFAERKARFFRLVITSAYPFQGEQSWNVQISEIALRRKGRKPKSQTARTYGKGRIYTSNASSNALYPTYDSTAAVLKDMGVSEDFSATGPVRCGHRRTKTREIYFVSNRTDKPLQADCTFRAAGGQPELWNPVNGSRRRLPQYKTEKGLTTIPMTFAPRESFFMVFPRGGSPKRDKPVAGGVNFPKVTTVATLKGPWDVSFDPKLGGPKRVTFDTLQDWTERKTEGIKYYSGIATYRKTFRQPVGVAAGSRACLDLGTVHEMARVRLNGADLGVLWCAPWRVDISPAVKAGENKLEIEVANLWPNRLIGDAAKPHDKRITRTTIRHPYTARSSLLPSGLLGPVTVRRSVVSRVGQ